MEQRVAGHAGAAAHLRIGLLLGVAGLPRVPDVRRFPDPGKTPHLGSDQITVCAHAVVSTVPWSSSHMHITIARARVSRRRAQP